MTHTSILTVLVLGAAIAAPATAGDLNDPTPAPDGVVHYKGRAEGNARSQHVIAAMVKSTELYPFSGTIDLAVTYSGNTFTGNMVTNATSYYAPTQIPFSGTRNGHDCTITASEYVSSTLVWCTGQLFEGPVVIGDAQQPIANLKVSAPSYVPAPPAPPPSQPLDRPAPATPPPPSASLARPAPAPQDDGVDHAGLPDPAATGVSSPWADKNLKWGTFSPDDGQPANRCISEDRHTVYGTYTYRDGPGLDGKSNGRQVGEVWAFWNKCPTKTSFRIHLATASATLTQFDLLPYEAVLLSCQYITGTTWMNTLQTSRYCHIYQTEISRAVAR